MNDAHRLPTFFISHGGGPWPWMQAENGGRYDRLAASLHEVLPQAGGRPAAILMVSAHWEQPVFTVMTGEHPGMLYDYGGFPEHTYQVHYPAPGHPALARRAAGLLQAAGFDTAEDPLRGFDHGTFSPMAVIRPEADVPVVQLSLRRGLDPRTHLAAGRALAPLRDEGVLVIGSGLSFHNLRAFGPQSRVPSAAFDAWLGEVLSQAEPAQREDALVWWERAPHARDAHPREEHLLPLMVAVGAAAGDAAERVYHETAFAGGITASSYRFGPAVPAA
jgi:aromatic ring-opening dioxygenase catalytic subunit (LigB family)